MKLEWRNRERGRRIVQNRTGLQLQTHRMPGIIQLFQSEHVAATDYDQHLLVWQSEHLIRGKQTPAALAFGLPVLGNHLSNRNSLANGHRGFDEYAHVAAPGRKILGCHAVRAAEHKLDICIADDFCP